MKILWNTLSRYKVWLGMLAVVAVLFAVFLWLADQQSFLKLIYVFILGAVGMYCLVILLLFKLEKKKAAAIEAFLENPDIVREEKAVNLVSRAEKEDLRKIGVLFRRQEQELREQKAKMEEYEEYIETWAHEVKTPLALMTFIMDNRKEEMSEAVYHKLEYSRSQMQGDIDKMLCYARLKFAHQDYLFEPVSLRTCCSEVIEDYKILLQEQHFMIINRMQNVHVTADIKGLRFMVSQVISNAIKYTGAHREKPLLCLYTRMDEQENCCILGIKDNGIGVKPYDLPFLFQKGFTGDSGNERKKATGMGLYLTKQVADALNIKIEIPPKQEEGFELCFLFPQN